MNRETKRMHIYTHRRQRQPSQKGKTTDMQLCAAYQIRTALMIMRVLYTVMLTSILN
jgi:hypothetical protein